MVVFASVFAVGSAGSVLALLEVSHPFSKEPTVSAQPKASPPKPLLSSVPPRPRLTSVRPSDSDAPRSGVRLAAPLGVPRPPRRPGSIGEGPRAELAGSHGKPCELEDTFVERMQPPSWADAPEDNPGFVATVDLAPTPSRPGRAAVRPRPARVAGAVVLPPALSSSTAPASVPGARSAPPAAPSSYKFRSFVETAQDWPIVDPNAEGAGLRRPPPRFGLDLSNASRDSLPAFVPPESLRRSLVPANELDSDDIDLAARDLEASARRARLTGFAILALTLVAVLGAWLVS